MKFLSKAKDGGPKSTVTGYWLVEIKSLFSIVLLRFDEGSRDAYHNHAFNAITWWLSGDVLEYLKDGPIVNWQPSFFPKYTPRSCFHMVYALQTTWALSFRGPWSKTWSEYIPATNEMRTLSNGRKIVELSNEFPK